MNLPCVEVQRSIPWLLDDELDPEQSLEVEAHLGECAACRKSLEREGQLRVVLRRAADSVAVPVAVRERLHDLMERDRHARTRGWSKALPAMAAAAILLSFIWKGTSHGLAANLEDIALRHAGNLPMDVVASDLTAVQTYLSRKLPFAVQLPSLSSEEPVKQLSGRVIQVKDHDAAYVRYETAHGRVSMVVYEDSANAEPLGERPVLLRRVDGITTARWKASGLVYSAVSNLPENEFSMVLRQTNK